MLNPVATFPFCPEQTDFLCFAGPYGFSAVDLNLVEGFNAGADLEDNGRVNANLTTIHLVNGSQYISTEPVPALVARFAEVKRRRYSPERAETERCEKNPLLVPQVGATPQAAASAKSAANFWTKKSE